eukprot:CAMPEP_0117618368 /NCGR_PEP_ID=MMETSP0784-20121206/86067_1 /TAXON_ID=39447 /ORGANISM="" /LENGTH=97 /DNA_ID=CAMNT_0005422229 /DNA_START=332 /DNA_END=623 /DNA_ORIENTATION=-
MARAVDVAADDVLLVAFWILDPQLATIGPAAQRDYPARPPVVAVDVLACGVIAVHRIDVHTIAWSPASAEAAVSGKSAVPQCTLGAEGSDPASRAPP